MGEVRNHLFFHIVFPLLADPVASANCVSLVTLELAPCPLPMLMQQAPHLLRLAPAQFMRLL